jgi:hypothetical protein
MGGLDLDKESVREREGNGERHLHHGLVGTMAMHEEERMSPELCEGQSITSV